MDPIETLVKQLRKEDIEHARRMTPEQKLLAGPELFDYACSITKAGIRSENPGLDEEGIRKILRDRIAAAERGSAGEECRFEQGVW